MDTLLGKVVLCYVLAKELEPSCACCWVDSTSTFLVKMARAENADPICVPVYKVLHPILPNTCFWKFITKSRFEYGIGMVV